MRDKTEKSHPQALRAKEDSTQSTAATQCDVGQQCPCMGTEFVMRCQQKK